nr:MAG TPA: protein of unknown function (DUF5361) [Bacteriophage sp.]
MRRVSVLVMGLPPGSCLRRQMGGPGAWSPVERAVHEAGYLIRTTLIDLLGGSGSRHPDPPEPPEPGWWRKQQDIVNKNLRKVRHLKQVDKAARAAITQQ